MRDDVGKAIRVAYEITGTELSKAGKMAVMRSLEGYPSEKVLAALERCVRTVRGRLSLAAIIDAIDDGRPGPDEAWAMVPKSEADSALMTDEMSEAMDSIRELLQPRQIQTEEGYKTVTPDYVAARKAFIAAYTRCCDKSGDARTPVRWFFSPGTDATQRERVLREGYRRGLLTAKDVDRHDPTLLAPIIKRPQLTDGGRNIPGPEEVSQLIADIKKKMGIEW